MSLISDPELRHLLNLHHHKQLPVADAISLTLTKMLSRILKARDDVLVLFPLSTNKLTMQWKGPYSILQHQDIGVDYLVKVHRKTKLYHINMLKKERERDPVSIDEAKVAQDCIIDLASKGSNTRDISVLDSSSNCKFDICPCLSIKQALELNPLLSNYSDVFSNDPGLTNTNIHDI